MFTPSNARRNDFALFLPDDFTPSNARRNDFALSYSGRFYSVYMGIKASINYLRRLYNSNALCDTYSIFYSETARRFFSSMAVKLSAGCGVKLPCVRQSKTLKTCLCIEGLKVFFI